MVHDERIKMEIQAWVRRLWQASSGAVSHQPMLRWGFYADATGRTGLVYGVRVAVATGLDRPLSEMLSHRGLGNPPPEPPTTRALRGALVTRYGTQHLQCVGGNQQDASAAAALDHHNDEAAAPAA